VGQGRSAWLGFGALGATAVLVGDLFERAVGLRERLGGGGAKCLQEQVQLRRRDTLAAVLPLALLVEQKLQLAVAADQLVEEREHLVMPPRCEQLGEDHEHVAA
jgi:hypothetical protein